jgi:hypothetical protein
VRTEDRIPRCTDDLRDVDEETSSLGWNLGVSPVFSLKSSSSQGFRIEILVDVLGWGS